MNSLARLRFPVDRSRGRRNGLFEDQLAVVRIDPNDIAFRELALQEPQRERILDHPLERPLQRTRAVGRIPAGLRDRLLRRLR